MILHLYIASTDFSPHRKYFSMKFSYRYTPNVWNIFSSKLPLISSLTPLPYQPGVEHPTGSIDIWPVQGIRKTFSHTSATSLRPPNSPSKLSPVKTASRSPHKPNISKLLATPPTAVVDKLPVTPKPKFLDRLEKYLDRELRLLGCPPTGPHELRLQAHREVFEYLIQDFKAYKPLLSAIKNEYELCLSHLEDVTRELGPIRVSLQSWLCVSCILVCFLWHVYYLKRGKVLMRSRWTNNSAHKRNWLSD